MSKPTNKLPQFDIHVSQKEIDYFKWRENATPIDLAEVMPDWNDPEYLADRKEIEDAVKRYRIANRYRVRFQVSWLSKKWNERIDDLLVQLVNYFNTNGAAWTAFAFRFGKDHDFGWLPESGERKPVRFAYSKKSGGMVEIPKQFVELDSTRKYRRLRKVPDSFEPYDWEDKSLE